MLKNYYKPTPRRWKNISLAWRSLIGAIGGTALVTNHSNLSSIVFIVGAIGEFFIQCQIDPDDTNK